MGKNQKKRKENRYYRVDYETYTHTHTHTQFEDIRNQTFFFQNSSKKSKTKNQNKKLFRIFFWCGFPISVSLIDFSLSLSLIDFQ